MEWPAHLPIVGGGGVTYGLSLLRIMSDHNLRAFHSRENLSLLTDTYNIFSLQF